MLKAILWFVGILFSLLLLGIVVFFINPIMWILGSSIAAFIVAYDLAGKDSD
jgi:uncharacterized membrane protein AbrB (regulator of aidB expression)